MIKKDITYKNMIKNNMIKKNKHFAKYKNINIK